MAERDPPGNRLQSQAHKYQKLYIILFICDLFPDRSSNAAIKFLPVIVIGRMILMIAGGDR